MDEPQYPYRLTGMAPERKIGRSAKERSRNRLTINYISDGTPEPRCSLRPLDEQARWLLDNRPHHVSQHLEFFGWCINAPSCTNCSIYAKYIKAKEAISMMNEPTANETEPRICFDCDAPLIEGEDECCSLCAAINCASDVKKA